MRKLYLIFNHKLTDEQWEDAKNTYGIEEVVPLPKMLREIWSHVPADISALSEYLSLFKAYISQMTEEDHVLVQGDFGATYIMVNWIRKQGAKAIYATTIRDVIEKVEEGKNIKISVFKHVRYREYGE